MQDLNFHEAELSERWVQTVRQQFPFFARNPGVLYLDNAATTQKPQCVLDAVQRTLVDRCANAGRGVYRFASQLAREIEETRAAVAAFIGAERAESIYFSSGATESLRTVAEWWGEACLVDGDEVLVCFEDHRSTIVSWLELQDRLAARGIHIVVRSFPLRRHGGPDVEELLALVNERTRVLSLTHVHNVFGNDAPVSKIAAALPERVRISLDASQSVGHIPVSVDEVDFLSFSAHKMFGITGTGVLWMHPEAYREAVARRGPEAVRKGSMTDQLRDRLEHRTLNIQGIVALGAAVQFVNAIGIERISERLSMLTGRLLDGLRRIPVIEFLPGPAHWACRCGHGILSFTVPGVSSGDLGFVLDAEGICVRTGGHCAYRREGVGDSVRVSLHLYNTEAEIDYFVRTLDQILAG